MKAVILALIFLILNFSMSMVVHSTLFTEPGYYEKTETEKYSGLTNFTNMTKTNKEPQVTDMLSLKAGGLTFNWLFQYLNYIGLDEELAIFIYGLNCLTVALYGVALVELFMKRSDTLR